MNRLEIAHRSALEFSSRSESWSRASLLSDGKVTGGSEDLSGLSRIASKVGFSVNSPTGRVGACDAAADHTYL
jgi:hypothetical protein